MRYFELFEDKSQKAKEIILQKYGEQMESKASNDPNMEMSPEEILDFIIQSDPTPKSIYTDWVLKMYLNGSIRYIEDILKTAKPLYIFDKLKNKLPVEQRDINKFKSFKDFDAFIEQFGDIEHIETRSNNEIAKTYEQELIDSGQAEIFYNSPDIKIIIPKTEEASIHFGKNTKWCTSAKNDNMFDRYNSKGPLYIILFKKENKRWQFHFETSQFMDELDEELSDEEVKSVLPLFKLNYEELINKNGKLIRFISNPSEELQLVAVRQYGYSIQDIKNPSEAVKLAAVQQNGLALKFIKNPSEEEKLIAVKQNGQAIFYINNPSEAVKLAAVQENGQAIKYIKKQSEEVKLAAVKQNGYAFRYIDNPSEELQLDVVEKDGYLIQYIKNPSEAVQLAAVKENENSIQFIKHPSEEVQLYVINKNYENFGYIRNPTEKAVRLYTLKRI